LLCRGDGSTREVFNTWGAQQQLSQLGATPPDPFPAEHNRRTGQADQIPHYTPRTAKRRGRTWVSGAPPPLFAVWMAGRCRRLRDPCGMEKG